MTGRTHVINKFADRTLLLILACGSCVVLSLFLPRDSLVHQVFSGIGYFGFLAYCGGGLALLAYAVRRFPRWTPFLIVPPLLCMLAVWFTVTQLTPELWEVLPIVLTISKWVINTFLAMLVAAATYGWTRWWRRSPNASVTVVRTDSNPYQPPTTTDSDEATNNTLRFVPTGEAALWFIASVSAAIFLGFEMLSRGDILVSETWVSIAGFRIDLSPTFLHLAILVVMVAAGVSAWLLRRHRHAQIQTLHEQHGPITSG